MTKTLVPLRPTLLACRQLDDADPALCRAWFGRSSSVEVDVDDRRALGLVTVDQDDATYIALDEATKQADVDVAFARSFYAGSKHASGPYSGEVMGVVRGRHPDDVAEALWVIKEHLREAVCFHTFAGEPFLSKGGPAFLAHVVSHCGAYLAKEAGVDVGTPLAYLIAPPLEAALAVDAALKAAPVRLAKWIAPPSETNFAGAFLVGSEGDVAAAKDAFVDAVYDAATRPLAAARRPDRLRR